MTDTQINQRLHPSRFSDRYYHLTSLRSVLEQMIKAHLSRHTDLVLVDLGCGSMPYRSLFAPHVARYIGVDLPGRHQADAPATQDGRTSLPDQCADVVLSTQVLEHVADPHAYLRECHRLLKMGGRLILSTHGYWMYHPDPTDFWRWTNAGLRHLVEASGFRITDWQGVMGLAPTGLQLLQDALTPKLPGRLRPLWALIMQALMALLDRLHSPAEKNHDACVFVVVAEKVVA